MSTEEATIEDIISLLEAQASATRLCSATLSDVDSDVVLVQLEDGRTGRLPATEMPNARRLPSGTKVILAEIEGGSRPLLSATSHDLLPLLLDGLVPELRDGSIRVMGVARRVGIRSKVAVASTVDGLDAVGALLGKGAGRIRLATRLLNGERVDVVSWHPEITQYAVNALAVSPISVEQAPNGTIRVNVPAHQVQAAYGGGRLNVGLASQLVRARIAIESA